MVMPNSITDFLLFLFPSLLSFWNFLYHSVLTMNVSDYLFVSFLPQQLCPPLNKFLQSSWRKSPLSPRWSAPLRLVLASYKECWWHANCLELRALTSGTHSTRFRWNRLWWPSLVKCWNLKNSRHQKLTTWLKYLPR